MTNNHYTSTTCKATETLLHALKQDYRQTNRKTCWGIAVLVQAFHMPMQIAIDVLTEKTPCLATNHSFVVQKD